MGSPSITVDDLPGEASPRPSLGDVLKLWTLILVLSPTSEIVFNLALGAVPTWLIAARIAVLGAVLALTVYARSLKVVQPFCIAFLIQLVVVATTQVAHASAVYRWIEATGGFVSSEFFLSSTSLMVIVPALLWCWPQRDRFFLRSGHLAAPVAPFKVRWRTVAPIFAVVSALCAWAFVRYTGAVVATPLAMIAGAVALAAVNALQEEFLNRNLFVGAVRPGFGPVQAVLASAFIFGIGHWNGLPAGVIGVLMTFVLGAVTATAMIQTRGMFWSWFMHFVPDCALFYFWGVGSVAHVTIGSGRL
jgi:membrane protease YdiL (CAAX protease family)